MSGEAQELDELMGGAFIIAQSAITPEGKPFVTLEWGKMQGQLTPEETLALGSMLIRAGESALHDGAIYAALSDAECTVEEIASMLMQVRRKRLGD